MFESGAVVPSAAKQRCSEGKSGASRQVKSYKVNIVIGFEKAQRWLLVCGTSRRRTGSLGKSYAKRTMHARTKCAIGDLCWKYCDGNW